jgi:hypothetical protein
VHRLTRSSTLTSSVVPLRRRLAANGPDHLGLESRHREDARGARRAELVVTTTRDGDSENHSATLNGELIVAPRSLAIACSASAQASPPSDTS